MNPVVACSRCPGMTVGCSGACPCPVDRKDIALHQAARYCPLARFGEGTDAKPGAWDENAPDANVAPPPPAVAPVAVPREKWPFAVRVLARKAKPGEVGIGDTLHRLIGHLGGDAMAHAFTRLTGRDCGCSDRAAKLNRLYPYEVG